MRKSSWLWLLGTTLLACSETATSPETTASNSAGNAGAPASGGALTGGSSGSSSAGTAGGGGNANVAGSDSTGGTLPSAGSGGGDVASGMAGAGGSDEHVIDPALPPGKNYDLTSWALQLPLESGSSVLQIKAPELTTYTSDFFYTTKEGAIGFWCPVTGATTPNSHYPRTELRELPAGGDWSIDGFHHLSASFTMLENPASKGTIIGQIHGNATDGTAEVLKLEWTTANEIVASVEANDNPAKQVDHTMGSYQLNQPVSYDIQLKDALLSVVVTDANGDKTFSTPYSAASWKSDRYYFKLGAYVQLDTGPETDGGRVAFSAFSVEHAAQ